MQAGIDSSFAGDPKEAVTLFQAAQSCFKALQMPIDAVIAGAWISSLRKQQHNSEFNLQP